MLTKKVKISTRTRQQMTKVNTTSGITSKGNGPNQGKGLFEGSVPRS